MAEEEKLETAETAPEGAPVAPVEQPPVPAGESTAPAEKSPAPAAAETAPVEDAPAPAETVPVEDAPAPAEDAPAGEAARPEPPKPKGPRIPLPSSLQEIVGALLFASESPLSANELRTCVRGVAPEEGEDAEVMSVYQSCTTREIDQALRGLEKELERSGCGFRLVCAGGTYRLQTAPACGRYVRALLKLDRPSRLSRASLETLAIIAYRQPITKAEIEQIRGVAVDTIVKSLVELQLVRLVGRSELPGHPFLYGTSPLFLEHFGLSSLSELNEIDPTLQRSNPRERAKLFVKEKKQEEPPAEEAASAATAGAEASAETAVESVPEGGEAPEGTGEEAPRRVSFRVEDEEDELIDDTPDAFDDEDDADEDEPLTGDGEDGDEDDEPLTDDGDDESLTDDEDDEPLTDDDDEGDEDDDEGEEEEDADEE